MARVNGLTHKYFSRKNYGFLLYEADGRQDREIYFKREDLACDWRGSRAWLFPEGIPVSFTVVRELSNKNLLALRATEIQSTFVGEEGDLATYWETGTLIRSFDEAQRFAFIERPCGDQIYFGSKSIKPEFAGLVDSLRLGDFIAYQVEMKAPGFWRTTNAELFSREENDRLHAGLPLEEPVKSEPASVLAPETRGLTIAEILRRKKSC